MAVLRRVCDESPEPIREINPEIPERLVALIENLHAKIPSERSRSARQVAELLERWLSELQRPLPPAAAQSQWSRWRPVLVTAGLVLLGLIAAFVIRYALDTTAVPVGPPIAGEKAVPPAVPAPGATGQEPTPRSRVSLLDALGTDPLREGKVQLLPSEGRIRFSFEPPRGAGMVTSWICSSKPILVPPASTRAILRFRAHVPIELEFGENAAPGPTITFAVMGTEVFTSKGDPIPIAELRNGQWVELSVPLSNVERWTVRVVVDATFQDISRSPLIVDITESAIVFEDHR
jgi:hypothetical protein